MTGMIEKVYSDALFQVAQENNTLDSTNDELSELATIFEGNQDFLKFLSTPVISADEKKKVLSKLFKDKVSENTFNFLCILTDKRRIQYIGKIASEFKDEYNNVNGILEVTVTTSAPLKKELALKLTEKLTSVTGKKIRLIEKVEPDILGGIILSYGNTQLDSSIKSKLSSIHSQIKSVIA